MRFVIPLFVFFFSVFAFGQATPPSEIDSAPAQSPAADSPPAPVSAPPAAPQSSARPGWATDTAPLHIAPWDWIQLTSGEWLKGEFLGMNNNQVDFDSDNLGMRSIDWEDIQGIYTSQLLALLLKNLDTAIGTLTTQEGKIYIEAQDLLIAFDDVLGIATGSESERDLWTGDIGLGIDTRKGNVDQKDVNFTIDIKRRTPKSQVALSYLGNYSEDSGEENANQHRLNANYDYRLNEDWFLRPVAFEYFRDPFQNIDSRWSVGFGAGLYLAESDDLTWTISSGPGYQETRYVETNNNQDTSVSSGAFFLSTDYEQEINSDVDFNFSYDVTLTNEESGRSKHHAVIGLSVDLTDSLDLKISAYWDRIGKPQADELGVLPEANDYRFVVGLNYEL